MKLTNLQLDALVREFSKTGTIQKQNAETKAKLYKEKKNIELAKKYYKIHSQIPESLRRSMYIDKRENSFLDHIVQSQFRPKKDTDDYSIVKNIIVIESIEAKNLEDLRKRVRAKYRA